MPRKFEWTKKDLRTLPKSKGEAIAEGERYYFSGSLCRYGHLCPRFLNGKCIECRRTRNRDRYRRLVAEKQGQAERQNGRVQNMLDLDAVLPSGLPTRSRDAQKTGSKY